MSYDVYPLRARGVKLTPEEVRESVRRGYIELCRMPEGQPVLIATLRSERGGIAGQLTNASVTKITREGLMIQGFELVGLHRQAWWCVPVRE